MDNDIQTNNRFFFLFRIGVLWRIIYGFMKLALGFTLLKFINKDFASLFYNLMSHELTKNSDDILIQTVGMFISKNNGYVTYFIASYFIFWGAIDIFLFINLLRNKTWAYPISIFLIIAFIFYGIYRFIHTHSITLLSIMILDIFIVWIINKEYKKLKEKTVLSI